MYQNMLWAKSTQNELDRSRESEHGGPGDAGETLVNVMARAVMLLSVR